MVFQNNKKQKHTKTNPHNNKKNTQQTVNTQNTTNTATTTTNQIHKHTHPKLFLNNNNNNNNNEDGRKEMFLFNDAPNTFYLWLYGIGHMVKDHSDSERQNPLLPHGLLFPVLLYAPSHRQDSTYHSLCYTSHGALAGMRNSLIIINE